MNTYRGKPEKNLLGFCFSRHYVSFALSQLHSSDFSENIDLLLKIALFYSAILIINSTDIPNGIFLVYH